MVQLCSYSTDAESVRFTDLDQSNSALTLDSLLEQGTTPTNHSSPSRILQHYHPGYLGWQATHRRVPPDNRVLLGDRPSTDTNLLIKVDGVKVRNAFEPLFGTLCLYFIPNDHEVHRVSECFNFDLTSPEVLFTNTYSTVVRKYVEVYQGSFEDLGNVSESDKLKQDPSTLLKTCMFSIPEDLKSSNLYLVWQLFKVLSGDQDKALAPYSSKTNPEQKQHEENCKRLHKYRQCVGFGATRVYDRDTDNGARTLSIPAVPTKNSLSESAVALVRALIPYQQVSSYQCIVIFSNVSETHSIFGTCTLQRATERVIWRPSSTSTCTTSGKTKR